MDPRRVGSYLGVDEEGFLRKVADRTLIQEEWRPLVGGLTTAYLDAWGELIHSVYLRGSIAKGQAIAGVSDVDSFAILKADVESPSGSDRRDWYRHASTKMESDFPQIAGVELGLIPFASAIDRRSIDSFIIEVEAICIYGDDLAERIAPFMPNSEAAFQTRHFRTHLAIFRREYPTESDDEKRQWLVWLMRRFLRLGMELVMEREKRYTRDLYLCYESFAHYYPHKRQKMWRAMELALAPVADAESDSFALDFGAWLEQEAEKCLKTWGQEFATAR